MEAKDTVMSNDTMDIMFTEYEKVDPMQEVPFDEQVAQTQAEISFKAGQEDVMLESKMGTLTVSSLVNKGRKEVVEWVENNRTLHQASEYAEVMMWIDIDKFEAKLKEWEMPDSKGVANGTD